MAPHRSGFDVSLRTESELQVRPLKREDRAALETLLRNSPNFTADEVATALEVIDEALAGDPEYIVTVVENADGEVAGYECHGPTPLTLGTFDLYWIAVDPRAQKRGYGRVLLRAAEDDVKARGGRLILIETSSQDSYEATIRFYKRAGYRLEAKLGDFYKPGDDKLVFAKNV
ncbi:MAG TPA: GNAT family N-acetyltransferase [Thermoanaerobaculia bacterium]|nr:GNAT family N-acetyltransferase [Thermoanaerobaculia bacterium]